MQLYYSHYSPFSRKVRIVIEELGLKDQFEFIQIHPETHRHLSEINPLGQVPALILNQKEILFNSKLICEYLSTLKVNKKLYPDDRIEYFKSLRLQALSDSAVRYIDRLVEEQFKPENMQSSEKIQQCRKTINECLDWLEKHFDNINHQISIGEISVACFLDYIGFHFRDGRFEWKSQRPNLENWFNDFKQRPSMLSTKYHSI
nr:glutathione S-transferase family protein [Acinetobacter sp. Marseille-Q1620]